MGKRIYIYGASGHGLVVEDIAKACGYAETIFIDDGNNGYPCFEEIKENNNIPVAFGIGSNKIRAKLFKKVQEAGFEIVTLIHPSAIVLSSAIIKKGTVVMPNVVINSNVSIGKGVILNTSSVIEHECIIEDFVHISPSVSLAGNVKVAEFTHIGIGTSCVQDLSIGKNCIIGAGSVVVKDINNNKKAFGNPCKEIEDLN